MSEAEGDSDSLVEAERDIAKLKDQLSELEISTLLSGEYDERSAVVTVRSGAGGDDATDWAQMLIRMYIRWAESRGYNVQELDTSYAEGAGIKSATIQVNAPYAYGTLSVEAGTHRLVRISPFDNQAAARPPSPPSRSSPSSNRPTTSRSTRTTCASTSTAPRAPAASR